MTIEQEFEHSPLISLLLDSQTHGDDIRQGRRLGIPVEEIIRMYQEYYEETGFSWVKLQSGTKIKIEDFT